MPALPAFIIGSMVKIIPASSFNPVLVCRNATPADLHETHRDTMSAKLAHYAVTQTFYITLDGITNIAQIAALFSPYEFHATLRHNWPRTGVLPEWRGRRHKTCGCIAVIAIFDRGDIQVNDIAIFSVSCHWARHDKPGDLPRCKWTWG